MIYQLFADMADKFLDGVLIGLVLYVIYVLGSYIYEWRKRR